MKYFKIVLLAVCILTSLSAFGKGNKPVYAFGVSASFTDTIVFYTEVQVLDSVALDKTGFLPQRESYSYQLKNYLEANKNLVNRTCMIYFSDNKRKLEKEYNKLLAKYKKQKNMSVTLVLKDEFLFTKPEY